MKKYSVSNFRIFETNEPELIKNNELVLFENILPIKENTQTQARKQQKLEIKKQKVHLSDQLVGENLLNDSEEKESINFRIERFLSVCEVPRDVALLAEKALERPSTIYEEDENEEFKEIPVKKIVTAKAKKKPSQTVKTLKQIEKANIIGDIIRNFDMDRYLKDFRIKESAIIKLDESTCKDRPVRDRLMKLMKSDEIRINDSHYMRRLSKQIERSYEEKQERLMENLIENERKRERLLKLKGLLSGSSEEHVEQRSSRSQSIHSPHLTALSLRKIQLK